MRKRTATVDLIAEREAKSQKSEAPAGLTLDVYTDQSYGPSRTYRGGSAFHTAGGKRSITVVGVRAQMHGVTSATEPLPKGSQVFPATSEAPAFILVKRGGRMGNVLVPATYPIGADGKPLVGPMMGGAYAATSDSRWCDLLDGFYGAVAIHDRFETQAHYDRNAD